MDSENTVTGGNLKPYFSRLGIWAFSIGTSIGWGSYVITCNTYLSQAGIMGTVLGLLLGMAVILIINRNLCYMINQHPDSGGIYAYGTSVNGHDTGFLIAWFLLLTYLAILWANITSVPLFASRFFGYSFRIGYLYTIFGYEIYLGEVLISILVMILVGLLCCISRRAPMLMVIIMALIFTVGLTVIALAAVFLHAEQTSFTFDPLFVPDKNVLSQTVMIAVISPWAFIGFENAAHFSEEYTFPVQKIRGVMLASIFATTGVYILMSILSVTAYPENYGSWLEYIRDMDNLQGLEALPAFYTTRHYLGNVGVAVMILALFSVIVTSLIGNLTVLSRLIYSLGRDHVAPETLSSLNEHGIPDKAIITVVIISCFIPFLGRTAIGWIVDVTTLGATIIYGFLSYAVLKDARDNHDRVEEITGAAGTILMIIFAFLLLAPKILSFQAMDARSYILFAAWAIVGLVVFHAVLKRDKEHVFGHSVIVWVILLFLMLLTSIMWVNRETQLTIESSFGDIREYFGNVIATGTDPGEEANIFLDSQISDIESLTSRVMLIAFFMFIVAVLIMLDNYRTAQKEEKKWIEELGAAKQVGLTDSLTSVKNKYAYTQWEESIDADIRLGRSEAFAVVVCDINDLKFVNDNYGHRAGDEYIKRMSAAICRYFSHSPVFRYGGDEFVVIVKGEDYANRNDILKNIISEAENNSRNGGDVMAVGMAEFDSSQHNTLQRVFETADVKMYERKQYLKSLKKK